MEKHVPKEFELLIWCKFILIHDRFDLKYLIKRNFVKVCSLGYKNLLDSAASNMPAFTIRIAIINKLYNNQFVSNVSLKEVGLYHSETLLIVKKIWYCFE